jgi:uncharacterized GH25 family protein
MFRFPKAGLLAALALSCATLHAHDFWIEPGTFTPAIGQVVGLRLRVGQNLIGDALPLNPPLVNRFIVDDGIASRPVLGRPGGDPAGLTRVAAPGLLIVGYHSKPSSVELAAEKFNAYLADEGLDAIIALRERRNETGSDVHESFARCAKSLLLTGAASETQSDRRLGFPLELVAERNPYALGADADLPVRLTFEDRPLAGALVVAMNQSNGANGAERQAARTDADGRVHLLLKPQQQAGGMWLIKAVHMVAAPADSGAEWSSYWASLTFEAGAEAAASSAR